MRSFSTPRPARALTGAAIVLMLVTGGTPRAGAEQLWTLTTPKSIVFQRLTPLGSLLVSTEDGLMGVDAATGKTLWTRSDILKLKECNYDEIANTSYGLVEFGRALAARSDASRSSISPPARRSGTRRTSP